MFIKCITQKIVKHRIKNPKQNQQLVSGALQTSLRSIGVNIKPLLPPPTLF